MFYHMFMAFMRVCVWGELSCMVEYGVDLFEICTENFAYGSYSILGKVQYSTVKKAAFNWDKCVLHN